MPNFFKTHKFFLLTICIYLMFAIVLSRFGPSRQILHSIHADSGKIFPPGKVVLDYFGSPWDATHFSPFGGSLLVPILILASVYMLMICLIGRAIILSFLGYQHNLPQIPLLFAGFLIGYTTVLFPLRIIFILFPVQIAAVLCLTSLVSWCIRSIMTTSRSTSQSRNLLSGFLFVVCVLTAIIYRVQSGRNFLVADSDLVFLDYVKIFKTTKNGLDFLPTWDQQSDEWIFTAPGVFLLKSIRYDSIWYLLTASFGQISLFFSVYLFSLNSFRKVQSSRWLKISSWIPSCLIFFSTPTWVPSSYISLFGGQNPVVYLGHAGRYVGLILPCILVFLFEQKSFDRDKRHLRQYLFFAGIGFMSIHLTLYFVLIGFILMFIKPMWSSGESKPILPSINLISSKQIEKFMFFPALIGVLLVYGLNHRDISPGVTSIENIFSWTSLILLIGSCMSLLLFKVSVRGASLKIGEFALFKRFASYGSAIFIGFVLSGNTLLTIESIRKGYKWFGSIFPSFLIDPNTRGLVTSTSFNLLRFSGVECWITGHCLSIWGFIAAYGIVVLLVLFALFLYPSQGKSFTIYETLFGLMLILFPLMFFIVDFTGGIELGASWIKTRFLEPVYYYLLVLSWLYIARLHKYRRLFLVLSGFWFIPLIILRIIPQIATNLVWIVKQVL